MVWQNIQSRDLFHVHRRLQIMRQRHFFIVVIAIDIVIIVIVIYCKRMRFLNAHQERFYYDSDHDDGDYNVTNLDISH